MTVGPATRATDRPDDESRIEDRARITNLANDGNFLAVTWGDGHESRFHAVWLRDNCSCPMCRNPRNGQRLFDIATLPDRITVTEATSGNAGELRLTFAPDGHRGRFDTGWLRSHCYSEVTRRERQFGPRPWGKELMDALPAAEHAEIVRSRVALRHWLRDICTYGFALLRGVPTIDGEVVRVAELFGFVRETNYGRVFDVAPKPAPNNLASSSLALGAHTDNPYRDPVPGLQLLHCLEADKEGGESVVVDGFHAAERLRARAPDRFELLCRHEVPFQFRDAKCDLRAKGPIITADQDGWVTAIRYNNRSAAAFDLPDEIMPAYYEAYRQFGRLLRDPDAEVTFRMTPGDLFIVDNRRVLHGRSDFKADRKRHLQGCYADRDALHSLLRTIDRESAQAVPNRRGQTSGSRADIVDTLAALYAARGGASYFGDETTVAEHMLQTAAEAGAGGAPDALVAAALLHDVAYLMEAGPTGRKLHQQHSRIGANFLALYFGPDVSEPVRFHVDAKRYLCAAEPGYFERLSNGSVRTLELQGGPMDTAEISAFKSNPHFSEAVQLRRWDEAGKRHGRSVPEFEHYRPMLQSLVAE